LSEDKNIFSAIMQKDRVLYHPYDSFNVVVNLLKQAARDPDVLVIKIIIYRIDRKSPIIDSLLEARQNGKSVLVLLELRAKFDEANNISWARSLENAGVYGLVDYKVHVKACLIARRENGKMVRYTHLSSGNYNSTTARVYGDIGYLTADPEIGADVSDLFNALTGYAQDYEYTRLLVAPKKLKKEIIARIERETEAHKKQGGGYIAFKLNGLVDSDIVKALYKASIAGVIIDLNVRGLCCLKPGIKGVSDNIRVISIVGRFLEHARIYYFRNGGSDEVLLGSSDMMPRNLKNRVEVLFPVRDERIKKTIIEYMLKVHLSDTVKARMLLPDGKYMRIKPSEGTGQNSQEWLIENRGIWHGNP
jgi:polyphosphate kinase